MPATSVPRHRARALSPSDKWMPMAAPRMPTVNPLPARRPLADTPYRPMTRPRSAGGASSWTMVCPIDIEARFAIHRSFR
jgi:hypothetical protein